MLIAECQPAWNHALSAGCKKKLINIRWCVFFCFHYWWNPLKWFAVHAIVKRHKQNEYLYYKSLEIFDLILAHMEESMYIIPRWTVQWILSHSLINLINKNHKWLNLLLWEQMLPFLILLPSVLTPQHWWLHPNCVLLLLWVPRPREARRASVLALHVLDDWWHLRICHGLGHHPTLW